MVASLRKIGVVDVLEVGSADAPLVDRAYMALMGRLFHKSFVPDQSVLSAMRQSHQVNRAVELDEYDVLIGLAASPAFAFVKTSVPTIQVTDATIKAMLGYYPMFSNLDPLYEFQMSQIGKRSHKNTDGFCVSSLWAKNSLLKDYSVDQSRVVVAPFGPSIKAIGAVQPRKANDRLQVLLVASDWHRKGGDLVVQAVHAAQRAGALVELTVIGEVPRAITSEGANVRLLGRMTAKEMSEHYASADLLIELSRASAGGVVLTDAMHHGLPAIAFDTGGVSDIISDNENGFLIDETLSDPEAIDIASGLLISLATDRRKLQRLAVGAKARAASKNNWESWLETVTALVQAVT